MISPHYTPSVIRHHDITIIVFYDIQRIPIAIWSFILEYLYIRTGLFYLLSKISFAAYRQEHPRYMGSSADTLESIQIHCRAHRFAEVLELRVFCSSNRNLTFHLQHQAGPMTPRNRGSKEQHRFSKSTFVARGKAST